MPRGVLAGVEGLVRRRVAFQAVDPAQGDGQFVHAVVEGAPRLTELEGRRLRVPPDTLLCSLDHEVEVAEL